MKKQVLLFSLILLFPMAASADAVKINGIYYNLFSKIKEAEVTNNPNLYSGRVEIPEWVEYDGIKYSVTSIGNSAFSNCRSLNSIIIGNNVTTIGNKAFYGCKNLITVFIGSGINRINENAFALCNSLRKVIVKDIAAWCNINYSTFDVSNPLSYAHHLYSDENTEITNLVIPNSVTKINNFAFLDCSGLLSVVIPNSVTSIEKSAFSKCDNLNSVTIPNSVVTIGEYAFYNCNGLISLTIGNSVKSIGRNSFSGCSSLTSVNFGNSIKHFGYESFLGCSSLKSVIIPNSVTFIDRSAFKDCISLTSITIGEKVEKIEQWAFSNCKNLENVYSLAELIPNTQTNMGSYNSAFDGSFIEYATLHVPIISIEAYKAAEPWKNFKSIVALDGDKPDNPIPEKCAKPTIGYSNGKLIFKSETEGAEFVSEITDADIKKYYDSEVQLCVTYNISVCATKSGYEDSETATATLCWIDVEPSTEGISDGTTDAKEIEATPVLIQSENGRISVSGAGDGTAIEVFGTNGVKVGAAVSHSGQAVVDTKLSSGSVAVVKIGEKCVKVVVK